MKYDFSINDKITISIQEAAMLTGIGLNKIREIIQNNGSDFTVKIGNKTLIKRKYFEEFLLKQNEL